MLENGNQKNVISVSKPFRIKRESENVLSNVQGFHTDSTMREEGIQNKKNLVTEEILPKIKPWKNE